MVIYVNNIPVRIISKSPVADYNPAFSNKQEFDALKGHIFFKNLPKTDILSSIVKLQKNRFTAISSVTFQVESLQAFKDYLKKNVDVVKAAGGVVFNTGHKILMMKRLGVWDLPKGKAEKGERSKVTARREVQEECGVEVFVGGKVATTWHTYYHKEKLVLKRTRWYSMGLISDANMSPQTEEGIEELKWMDTDEVSNIMASTYHSIQDVLGKVLGGSVLV